MDNSDTGPSDRLSRFREYVQMMIRLHIGGQSEFCKKHSLSATSFNTYLRNGSGGGEKYLKAMSVEFGVSIEKLIEIRDSDVLFKIQPTTIMGSMNSEEDLSEELRSEFDLRAKIQELEAKLLEAETISMTVEKNGKKIHIRKGESGELVRRLLDLE